MVWSKDKHGLAVYEDLPLKEMDARADAGENFYASLSGLILNEGVEATAIREFSATPLFDGLIALEKGGVEGLEPVGTAADYRVECLNGELLIPPRHGEDVRQAFWEGELKRTGERRYEIAMLDSDELTVFFTGARANYVSKQLSEAVRKLHPEEKSVYTAISNIPGLTVTRGSVIAGPGDKVAGAIRTGKGDAVFFLEDDEQALNEAVLAHYQADGRDGIFEVAEARGDRIDIGFLWLSGPLIDQAVEMRASQEEDASLDM